MNLVLQFLKNLRPFIRKGSTTFDEVVATFKDKFGRDPEGVEVISIRKEFKDAAEGEKVIPFPSGGKDKVKYYTEPGKDFSPNMKRKSPYSGKTYHEMLEEKYGFELRGTESMGQIKQMIKNINVNKELDEIIKTKKPKDLKDNIEDPDFASGGRVGYGIGGGVESVTNSALDDEEAANLNPARAFQMARSFFGNPVVQGGIAIHTGGLSGLLGWGKKAVAAEGIGQLAGKAINEKMAAAAAAKAQEEIDRMGYKDYGQGAATGGGGYNDGDGGSYSGASTDDYGGGEKDGGFIDGTNRRKDFEIGGPVGQERKLTDYIEPNIKAQTNSSTPVPGVDIDEKSYEYILKLKIPLDEKLKLIAEFGGNKSRIEVDDSELASRYGVEKGADIYKGGSSNKKFGAEYTNDGLTFGGRYDPDSGNKNLYISKRFQDGGRVGFSEGGGYWEIVGDAHTKAGGEEGTGLSLFDFADMYFPNPLAEGGLTTMFKRK